MLSGWKTYVLTGAAAALLVLGNGIEVVTNTEELIKLLQVAAIAALRAGVAKAP